LKGAWTRGKKRKKKEVKFWKGEIGRIDRIPRKEKGTRERADLRRMKTERNNLIKIRRGREKHL